MKENFSAMARGSEGQGRADGKRYMYMYQRHFESFLSKRRIYEIRLARVQSYMPFRICDASLVRAVCRMQQYAANFRVEIPRELIAAGATLPTEREACNR